METINVLYKTRNKPEQYDKLMNTTPTRTITTNYEKIKKAISNIPSTSTFINIPLSNGSVYSEYIVHINKDIGKGRYEKELGYWGSYLLDETNELASITVNSNNPEKTINALKTLGMNVTESLEQKLRPKNPSQVSEATRKRFRK